MIIHFSDSGFLIEKGYYTVLTFGLCVYVCERVCSSDQGSPMTFSLKLIMLSKAFELL